ncbi:hypothetical protein P3T23_004530 [Paraburkholderia sp. GAS448]|uniref:hypothetical protein n=1 Tax=Paraburkholderia sp. GAS448 TaxID=3035136 RepID=UPI003D1AD84B
MGDFTNRDNKGNGKAGGRGMSQDFTNRMNSGTSGARSSRSNAQDMTSAVYGTRAPRSKGFTKVVKNRELGGQFRDAPDIGDNSPKPFDVPGFRRGPRP